MNEDTSSVRTRATWALVIAVGFGVIWMLGGSSSTDDPLMHPTKKQPSHADEPSKETSPNPSSKWGVHIEQELS